MKVFFLYPDRDFDMTAELSPLWETLVQDLGLETLFSTMAGGDKFVYQVVQRVILTRLEDPSEILYRQEILKDCLNHPELIHELYRIPLEFLDRKRKQWLWFSPRHSSPSLILSGARQLLESSLDLLHTLRTVAEKNSEHVLSKGFRRFFSMIQQELDDTYLSLVETHVKSLRFPGGVLLSAQLGKGNEGTGYLLRKPNPQTGSWITRIFSEKSPVYSFSLHPRDESGARILSELRDRGLARVANSVAQAAEHIEQFFHRLRWELSFYIGCINLEEQLKQLRAPFVFPKPYPLHEPTLSFSGLYDICLALSMGKRIVGNQLHAKNRNPLVIMGPNKGGKTTFLRSLGQAQLLMQAGMFVPAETFSANPVSGIFTHFLREEDKSMERGKFEEELQRMSQIVDRVKPNSLVLMNESFSATNEREGSEVALQVVTALLESNVKVAYVTHLYEFAHRVMEKRIPASSYISLNPLFLVAERLSDGTRTYRILEGTPLKTSYGEDLYHRVFAL
ncbi:MAG: DNA mismatch repair protein MutS [Spirochaetes bacterium]|nr:DNA mismatch repair protein MutS [Spirochaetota bacterium]